MKATQIATIPTKKLLTAAAHSAKWESGIIGSRREGHQSSLAGKRPMDSFDLLRCQIEQSSILRRRAGESLTDSSDFCFFRARFRSWLSVGFDGRKNWSRRSLCPGQRSNLVSRFATGLESAIGGRCNGSRSCVGRNAGFSSIASMITDRSGTLGIDHCVALKPSH